MTSLGEIVTAEDLNAVLNSIAPDAELDDEYAHFLQPQADAIKKLLGNAWDPLCLNYGSIRTDWPLCYDFAELAAAAVRLEAYRQDWPCRPAFGVLRYTMNAQSAQTNGSVTILSPLRHAINFAVLDDCHILYFEPQTGEWLEQPKDWKSTENLYI